MNEPKPHSYEFEVFRLDLSKRVLLRVGEPVPLTPKVFDTLLYLVEHPGIVLSKDELMVAVWPDTVVEENNLGQNISKLRGVLGESRGENRYIETVPGRGYRFVADVKMLADENGQGAATGPELAAEPAGVAPSPSPQAQRGAGAIRNPGWVAVLVSVLVVVLGSGAFYLWRERTQLVSVTPVRTIAVLPFKPLVVETRDESLEMGMADTLIARLSNIREVTVRPLASVRRYGGPEQNSVAAGRELRVEAVLDGTIQRWGDRIRVTALLVRVDDGKRLWAGQFDARFGDIFSVQDSISERVTSELALELVGEERERVARRHTADAEAYLLYLKGRFFWDKRTADGTRQAAEFFQRALDRDPTYALAYAGVADCYRSLPIRSDVPPREAFPKAKEAALEALKIDERLAEAHTTLGWIRFFFDWDWEGSEKDFRRALQLSPNYPLAHLGYAHLLSNLRRHEEALEEADRALSLDPLSIFTGAMKVQFLFHARRYPEAIDQLHKTLELEPNFWITQALLGNNYARDGRYEEALEAFTKARRSSGTTGPLSLIGYTYAVSGRRGEAERTLRELNAISKQRYVPPFNIALVYHGLGNSDATLSWLEKAYEERNVHMVFLGVDPKWDVLRTDPGFVNLLKRMILIK